MSNNQQPKIPVPQKPGLLILDMHFMIGMGGGGGGGTIMCEFGGGTQILERGSDMQQLWETQTVGRSFSRGGGGGGGV